MNRLQLCNVYTREVLREQTYEKPDMILDLIEQAKNNVGTGLDCFLLDSQFRTYRAEYVTHTVSFELKETVYKIFFKVKLSEIQAKVRR